MLDRGCVYGMEYTFRIVKVFMIFIGKEMVSDY